MGRLLSTIGASPEMTTKIETDDERVRDGDAAITGGEDLYR
jgi:hypothetical protein